MFTVTSDGMGHYIISIGDGKPTEAATLQYVGYAMEHYFRDRLHGYGDGPFDYEKHRQHNEDCGCCPLCAKMAEAAAG